MEYLKLHYLVAADNYKYTETKGYCDMTKFRPRETDIYVKSYSKMMNPSIEQLKINLVMKGPVLTYLASSANSFKLYKAGVYDDSYACG